MALQTTCQSCGTPCSLSEALLGKKVRCPHCREIFVAEAPPPPEESGVEIVEEPSEPEPEQIDEVLPAPRPRPHPRQSSVLSRSGTPQKRVPSVISRELQAGILFYGISAAVGLVFMCALGLLWPWFMSQGPGKQQTPARNESDLNVILEDLQSPDNGVRQRAAERLIRMKPDEGRRQEVAQALAAHLQDNHDGTHDAAARALVSWATREQVPALIDVLDHESGAVRESALEALGNLKDARAVTPVTLRLLLPQDRKNASKTLQNLGPMAEKEVLKHVDDPDADLRVEICRILKRIGTRESVQALQTLKDKDKERRVRVAALEALTAVNSRP
jgi:hypothetical protein